MIRTAIAGLFGAIVMTLIFASPIIAVVSWIGFAISEPRSGGWLALAIGFSIIAAILTAYFVVKMRETKSLTSIDLQIASALPPSERKHFLNEASWITLTSQHLTRGDGVGATFEVQRSSRNGKMRPYFVFDGGFDLTDDILEWGRVTAIQLKADFDKEQGRI